MLSWAVTFLVVALIAGILGLSGIAGAATQIAWILFVVFMILFLVGMLMGRRTACVGLLTNNARGNVFSERFHDASIASSEISVLVSVPVALPCVNLADRERSGSRTLSWRVYNCARGERKAERSAPIKQGGTPSLKNLFRS